jgi:hypothetical protein
MSTTFTREDPVFISGFEPSEGLTGSAFVVSGSGISTATNLYFVDAFDGHMPVSFVAGSDGRITGTVPNVRIYDDDFSVKVSNVHSSGDKCCFNIRQSGCVFYCNVEVTGSLQIGGVNSNPATTGFLAIDDNGFIHKRQGLEYETGINTSFFSHMNGGDQTIPGVNTGTLEFDTVSWNNETNFNTSNYRLEIESDNRYLIDSKTSLESNKSSAYKYDAQLVKNGSTVVESCIFSYEENKPNYSQITRIVDANSGDYYEIRIVNEDASSVIVDGNSANTYFAGNILGRGGAGPAGPQGIQGAQGVQGDVGPTGGIGPSGGQGIQGLKGGQGDQGILGPSGTQGIQGQVGPTGINWSGYWSPSITYQSRDAIYNSGSTYISVTADNLNKIPSGINDDNWHFVSSGAKGIQGQQGIQGLSGERGLRGFSVGAAVQGVYSQWGTELATTLRFLDTPTNSQGVEAGSAIIYPVNPGYLLAMEIDLSFSATDYTEIMACLFKDDETTPRKAWLGHVYGVNMGATLRLKYTTLAENTLAQTWKLRIGGRWNSEQQGTVYLNRTQSDADIFGDAATSSITIYELLPEQPPP